MQIICFAIWVPETGTPGPDKLLKTGCNDARADQTHPADRDRRVLEKSFGGVWPGGLYMVTL